MIAARARALIGVPFRLHGRDPATGLDCVGLAAAAYGVAVAGGYAWRSGDTARVAREAARLGLVRADGDAAGDLLLLAGGPGQLHLAIRSEGGTIHACARARRVVERPGEPPFPLMMAWRGGAAWRP